MTRAKAAPDGGSQEGWSLPSGPGSKRKESASVHMATADISASHRRQSLTACEREGMQQVDTGIGLLAHRLQSFSLPSAASSFTSCVKYHTSDVISSEVGRIGEWQRKPKGGENVVQRSSSGQDGERGEGRGARAKAAATAATVQIRNIGKKMHEWPGTERVVLDSLKAKWSRF